MYDWRKQQDHMIKQQKDMIDRTRKQQEDMYHAYHYKKMQDEKRRQEEDPARRYGTITPPPNNLGRKVAKALGVIIAFGAVIIMLRALFNMM